VNRWRARTAAGGSEWPRAKGSSTTGPSHELCHALDAAEGLSWDARDLFPEDELPENYPFIRSSRGRVAEVFARACDLGPGGGAAALPPACATEAGPAHHFLDDRVFPAWEPPYSFESWSFTQVDLPWLDPDRLTDHDIIASADALYVPRAAQYLDDSQYLSFVRVDGGAASDVGGIRVSADSRWSVLGGDGDPLLVVLGPAEGEATARRLVGDELVPAPFPEGVTSTGPGVVSGDTAWVRLSLEGEVERLWRIDLLDGSLSEAPQPPDGVGGMMEMLAGPGGVLGVWGSAYWQSFVRLDPDREEWQRIDPPEPLTIFGAVALEDGTTVVSWGMQVVDRFLWSFGAVEDGRWVLHDPCLDGSRSGPLAVQDGRPVYVEMIWYDPDRAPVPQSVVEIGLP
jgi:hypothetical protein